MWKDVKETQEADKYNKMSASDKDRYKEEMEGYVPNESSKTTEDSEISKKKRSKKPKDAPKNAKSVYVFYCKEMHDSVKEDNPDLFENR